MASFRVIKCYLPMRRDMRRRKKLILMLLIILVLGLIYVNLPYTKLDMVNVKDQFGNSFTRWGRNYSLNIVQLNAPFAKAQRDGSMTITAPVSREHFSPGSKNASCDERIVVSSNGILLFKNMTIRSKRGRAKAAETHLGHPKEEDEFYTLEKGFFTLTCNQGIEGARQKILQAKHNEITKSWTEAMDFVNNNVWLQTDEKLEFRAGYFLAIQRVEYANVYWTVIDLMDIFITTQYFNIDPEKLTIIILDAHIPTSLDPFWSVVFRDAVRPVDAFFANPKNVLLENLIWRYPRIHCPFLEQTLKSLEYIQPFRSFVLGRFGISAEPRHRNCTLKKFRVLISFRRDYQSHPRNLDGTVDRKIANELDVVNEINATHPSLNITAVQLDALPLRTQLELIAFSDIFFGMHGAAHGFTVFMPPGGVVIELFNFNANNWHMGHIAILSGHKHIPWVNRNSQAYNKKTRSTTIPSGVPSALVKQAAQILCP